MLGHSRLVDSQVSANFALAEAPEVVESKAFILAVCKVLRHCSPHLAHIQEDKARSLLSLFVLLAVISLNGGRENSINNEGVIADFLESVVKSGHL